MQHSSQQKPTNQQNIEFIMLNGKSLINYTNLYSPNEHEKNYKISLKYFH